MKVLRSKAPFFGVLLVVIMLTITIPCQTVSAALIDTESIARSARGQEAHDQVKQFFAREDVQAALIAQGIDPLEAKRRIDVLSDDEVIRAADQLDELPSGGSLLLVGVAILVVTILVYAIILLAVEATE